MPGHSRPIDPVRLEGDYDDIIGWINLSCNNAEMILFTYYESRLMKRSDEFIDLIGKLTEELLPDNLKYDEYFKIALLAVLEGCNYHKEMEDLEYKFNLRYWTQELSERIYHHSNYPPYVHLKDLESFREDAKLLIIPKFDQLIDEFIRRIQGR